MKIICYGDSNTFGYDPRSYFGGQYGPEDRWVDILGAMLDCEVINFGENGREIPRRESELLLFEQLIEKSKPIDLLTILLGTNDLLQGKSVADIAQYMYDFLERVNLPRFRIILIAPPPLMFGEWVPFLSYIRASQELSEAYKAVADRLGVRFVRAEEWNVKLTFDGVHFTQEGHRAFAEGLFRYLRKGE